MKVRAQFDVDPFRVERPVVVGVEVKVVGTVGMANASVRIAPWQEGLGSSQLPCPCVGMVHGGLSFQFKSVQPVIDMIVYAAVLHGPCSVFYGGHPLAALSRALPVVEIVEIGKDGKARMGGISQCKEACQVAFISAASSLHITHPAYLVVLLQLYVHHQHLVANVFSHQFAQSSHFVVNPDVLHHIGGEVFEHDGAVFLEEILAVKQQTFHLFAVDEDASVILQLRARQLADERIQHRTFLQLESISVVDDRIAAKIKLHLRGLDDRLVQFHLARGTFHDNRVVQDGHFALSQFVYLVGSRNGFIPVFAQA